MKLAFYRGPGNWITNIIRLVTFGPYSHVELVFPDGRSFSASGKLPDYGVRWVKKEFGNDWDLVELNVSDNQIDVAIEFCNLFVGLDFDYGGMYRFIFPWYKNDPDKWYCSEICLVVLQQCFNLYPGVCKEINPNMLYKLVKEKEYET